jgi:hypothetical protein
MFQYEIDESKIFFLLPPSILVVKPKVPDLSLFSIRLNILSPLGLIVT